MENIKIPTLTKEQIDELGLKLAEQYMSEARNRVLVDKKYPQNRYTFTQNNFRSIDGWDEEWYQVMAAWRDVLVSKGWKERWADEQLGESNMSNFQYFYDSDPVDFGVEKFDCFAQWKKLDVSKLNPQYCSQLALKDQ